MQPIPLSLHVPQMLIIMQVGDQQRVQGKDECVQKSLGWSRNPHLPLKPIQEPRLQLRVCTDFVKEELTSRERDQSEFLNLQRDEVESDQKPQCLAVIGKCWSSEPSPIQGVDGREPSPGSGLEPASSVWAQSWSSAVGPSGRSGGSALGSRSHMLAWAWRREAALLFTPSAGQGPIVSSRPWGWGSALISLGGEGGGCSTSTRQASSAEA